MGYSRAGFDVTGVDINPQPNYPFDFVQGDALEFLDRMIAGGTFEWKGPGLFDAVHASPPCQAHSSIAKQQRVRRPGAYEHPDLVDATRDRLLQWGLPCVIENVIGAPLKNAVTLCGSSFGLNVRRHRLFETHGFYVMALPCAHHWQTPRFRSLDKRSTSLASVVGVHGHINYTGEREIRELAMDVDWMSPYELAQAIPPAYTEHIGAYLLAELKSGAARTSLDLDERAALIYRVVDAIKDPR